MFAINVTLNLSSTNFNGYYTCNQFTFWAELKLESFGLRRQEAATGGKIWVAQRTSLNSSFFQALSYYAKVYVL